MEYYIYHLVKILSAVFGAILIYSLIMKFGRELQYFFLGKTYIQFNMLDNVIEIPEKTILLFVNITQPEEVLTDIGKECFNTTCLCLIKFEGISRSSAETYEEFQFKTKYVRGGEPYIIKVNIQNLGWEIFNVSNPQVFGTVYDDYSPKDESVYDLINLNSKIFCKQISKRFYLNYTFPRFALAGVVNPSDNKPLKLFVSYEKIEENKYIIIINQVVEEPED